MGTMMSETVFSLVDSRGREYLTRKERDRFLEAARRHLKPSVRTLARGLAPTGTAIGPEAREFVSRLRSTRSR